MSVVADKLEAIAEEIAANPSRWTKYAFARNEEDMPVQEDSENAVCWCAMGFLQRDFDDPYQRSSALRALRASTGGLSVPGFNDLDSTAPSDVARWFRSAAGAVNR